MGSVLARPPARADLDELTGAKLALDGRADAPLAEVEVEPPGVICVGAEREGLSPGVGEACDELWTIPLASGVESLNAAAAAAIAIERISSPGGEAGAG